jgi:hypothetical protein
MRARRRLATASPLTTTEQRMAARDSASSGASTGRWSTSASSTDNIMVGQPESDQAMAKSDQATATTDNLSLNSDQETHNPN